MKQAITHTSISASAGSGKTYQLAHRYIKLLACGVGSDRIAALTFSRKSAGEIFDSVVKYLCAAADSDEQAAETAAQIGLPALQAVDFRRLLRGLLDRLHRLHIGTLDSFFVGVVRTFPIELGLSVEPTLMDDAEALGAKQEVLRLIFDRRGTAHDGVEPFLAAFKQATFGQEAKRLDLLLDDWLHTYRTIYRAIPRADAWGDKQTIWRNGFGWTAVPDGIPAIAHGLMATLAGSDWDAKVKGKWQGYLQAVSQFGLDSAWTDEVSYVFKKLAEDLDGLREGKGQLSMYRKVYALTEEQCRLALATFSHIMATVIQVSLEQTQGIFKILDQFERIYDQTILHQGRVTFEDCQYLLAQTSPCSGQSESGATMDKAQRIHIDYRLDARLDHWLLDEFQDTSDLQWEGLANLADEILQDTSGQRSFFYVGDVKQAIYGWRGGNANLFGHILDRYGSVIQQERLAKSYRSSPEVVQTVNQMFSDLSGSALPCNTVQHWAAIWDDHTWASGHVPDHGYAGLLECSPKEGGGKPTVDDRYDTVARMLNEINPLSRGLTVGVLVRTNRQGRAAMNHLRRACPSIHIAHEGRVTICDNPVVALLLSLVQYAFHPGDTWAWRHLQSSPLGPLLQKQPDQDRLGRDLLNQIYQEGFRGLIRAWGEKLDKAHPLDAFGHKRLGDLLEAASSFDRLGDPNGNRFLTFVQMHEAKGQAVREAVRVMTVHQAKGLEFDIVILPQLQEGSMTQVDSGELVTFRSELSDSPEQVLRMPRREIMEADPVLSQRLDRCREESCFEALCVLYVAMTRAKHALYMITECPGRSSKSLTPAALVKSQLCDGPGRTINHRDRAGTDGQVTVLYEQGQPDWYRANPPQDVPKVVSSPRLPTDYAIRLSPHRRMPRLAPSVRTERGRSVAALFDEARQEGLDLGSAVHALFERVGWIEQTDLEQVIRAWWREYVADLSLKKRAEAMFRKAMEHDAIRSVLVCPGEDADLWCEREFEIVTHGRWVSGKFDRVVIRRDQGGSTDSVVILDFKTDRVEDDLGYAEVIERYRPQMELYRTSLSQMLSLDHSLIAVKLIFTSTGQVRDIDSATTTAR